MRAGKDNQQAYKQAGEKTGKQTVIESQTEKRRWSTQDSDRKREKEKNSERARNSRMSRLTEAMRTADR